MRTGRNYRLPTEAEWEYACRERTATPFHFAPTLSSQYSNETYGSGEVGEFRGKTTPVDHFQIGNANGLIDTHGNVCEWCLDHWHENYDDNVPTDGSAWLTKDDKASRILRGGSWFYALRDCRFATRDHLHPGNMGDIIVYSRPDDSHALCIFATVALPY